MTNAATLNIITPDQNHQLPAAFAELAGLSITDLMLRWRVACADVRTSDLKLDGLYAACKTGRHNSRKWQEATRALQAHQIVFDDAVACEAKLGRAIARTSALDLSEILLRAEVLLRETEIEAPAAGSRLNCAEELGSSLAADVLRLLIAA